MDAILDFINAFFGLLTDLLSWVLDGLVFVIKGALFLIYDGLLTAITVFVNALDLSNIVFTSATTWGLLPPQMLYVIQQVGIPQCLTMVFFAYILRLTMNILPASWTRL